MREPAADKGRYPPEGRREIPILTLKPEQISGLLERSRTEVPEWKGRTGAKPVRDAQLAGVVSSCHPERSEGSLGNQTEILRFAQNVLFKTKVNISKQSSPEGLSYERGLICGEDHHSASGEMRRGSGIGGNIAEFDHLRWCSPL